MLVRRREVGALTAVLLPACLVVLLSPPAGSRQTPPPSHLSTVGAVPLEGRDVVRLGATPPPTPPPSTVGAVPLQQGRQADLGTSDEETSTTSRPLRGSSPTQQVPFVTVQTVLAEGLEYIQNLYRAARILHAFVLQQTR